MKKKITDEKNTANNTISFYLVVHKLGRIFLMDAQYSKGVYTFFEGTRSYAEVMGLKGWGRNPRLDHVINRLPGLVKFGMNELLAEQKISQTRPRAKQKRCENTYDYFMDAA